MLRFALVAVLFAAVSALPINDELKSSDIDVFVGGRVEEYLDENPGFEIVKELAEVESLSEGSNVTSTFKWGNRERGDALAQSYAAMQNFDTLQDVVLDWIYPTSNTTRGYTVTYVELDVQRTNKAKAYLVDGGLGDRSFKIMIKVKQTLFYRLSGRIYGHK